MSGATPRRSGPEGGTLTADMAADTAADAAADMSADILDVSVYK